MKKLTKIISVLVLLFTIFASLGSSMMETAEASKDNEVSVTLNKKKMTVLPDPLIQNTGGEMTEFAGYDNLPNVTFAVHDVTAEFYGYRAAGDEFDAAMGKVALNPVGGTVVGTNTTGANGLVGFDLPEKSGGKDAVYVFVETNAPSGTIKAANMVLVLPMYNHKNKIMKDILLYPKNVVSADGEVIVTKKGTADGKVLKNAQFIVSRELTTGNVEYLGTFNSTTGLNNWVDTEGAARIFTTNASGQFTISNLEHGDYKLIEKVAPTNAAIIGDGITPFTIGKGKPTKLALEVLNDTIIIDKDHEGTDIDYNVGDDIPYSITLNIPNGMGDKLTNGDYKHPSLIITDTPDVGLQFRNITSLKFGNTSIMVDPSWMNTAGNGFVMTIPASALANYAGQTLTITYNMYLDGNAEPDKGYNNLAKVTTSRITDEDDEIPEVFTGGKKFLKKDKNFDQQNGLNGAKFVVRDADEDDAKYLKIAAGTKAISWVNTLAEATEFESLNGGHFEIAGLEYGTYYLEETVAPADYVMLDNRLEFKISKNSYKDAVRFDVLNVRKGRLPSTGGSGIVGFIGLGAVLVASTGGYYIKRKRQE